MTTESTTIDVESYPDLTALIERANRAGEPTTIRRAGRVVAFIVPVSAERQKTRNRAVLVDTSNLPPVADETLDDVIRSRPAVEPRSFTWEEIKEALDEERATAWRSKHS